MKDIYLIFRPIKCIRSIAETDSDEVATILTITSFFVCVMSAMTLLFFLDNVVMVAAIISIIFGFFFCQAMFGAVVGKLFSSYESPAKVILSFLFAEACSLGCFAVLFVVSLVLYLIVYSGLAHIGLDYSNLFTPDSSMALIQLLITCAFVLIRMVYFTITARIVMQLSRKEAIFVSGITIALHASLHWCIQEAFLLLI